MTLRVGKLVYGLLKLLPCLLAVLLASSCSSDQYSDELKGGETLVTLTVATGNGRTIPSRATSDGTGSVTTGVASSTDKDNYIKDLLVYIFDKNGNVIGTDQGNYTVTDASTITVKVKTRPAEGCTVYAIANAATLTEKAFPFAGVSTLDEFKSQVMSFSTDVDGNGLVAQEKSTCLLMVGCLTGFNTTATANTNITLQRLASKITFKITAEANVINDISYPVVIDSYRLCNVPNATFYTHDDMDNPTLPTDIKYLNFSEQNKTPVKSWKNPTVSYVQYVYANPATDETHATYLLINAHAQASSSNTAKIWESVFKVYLKEVKQGEALMTKYQILPNYHYTVNITIKGSKVTADNGVECTAYPFFSSSNPDKNLDDWIDGQEKIDFDYEEK